MNVLRRAFDLAALTSAAVAEEAMNMLNRAFKLAVVIITVTVVVGFGLLVFGEINISSAAEFDQIMDMVDHQTEQMGKKIDATGAFVTTDIAEITFTPDLIDEWMPRYNDAQLAYQKFDVSIATAEERAQIYFAAQQALTNKYHDPEWRAQAQERDEADFALYSQWRDQAHRVRSQAQAIMLRLDDMDTDLRKLKLASEMSFNASAFSEMPSAIAELDKELAQFQIASKNIREITASPFAAQ